MSVFYVLGSMISKKDDQYLVDKGNNTTYVIMRRIIIKVLGMLLLLCMFSCKMGRIRIYPRGTYDKSIEKTQSLARDIFPDTLMQFFPSIKERDTSFTILSLHERLFDSFPLVKKTELQSLPWQYGELYQIKDSAKYHNSIDSLLKSSIKVLDEEDEVFSYQLFCLQDNVHDNWPTDENGFPLYLVDADSLNIKGTTAILSYSREKQLTENDFRLKYSKDCPQLAEHGYSCGITFSAIKQEIYYWILAW